MSDKMDPLISIENFSEKPNKINLLTKRELERQLNIQKRKDDKELLSASNEKLEIFEAIFAEKKSYIESLIKNSRNLSKNELPDHFNTISKEILTLQKYVAASNIFLRHYDLQRCQNTLQELTNKAKYLENELLPKKKFSFKNRMKEKDVKKEKEDEVDSAVFKPHVPAIFNSCGFFNRSDETLNMLPSEIFRKDVSLENLENCIVILKGTASTLHLNHLKNCKVFTGPVSTSIFAEHCLNCTLVIACQQLRLHSSENVQIYLHVTSRAIMEDCKDIAVAPYNLDYKGIT
ncbi:unnamed protein product [Acanthoscelides obtectus]|uniref:C-CAP/cofactor C-like domain-containing protein n=1 Tax=Acanthoscelides obtectus TaxID=200917 RepID=A0A9P0LXH9_ACAOB|nr:unnamed protein product [Acanthoscelides obtectus]CAK1645137.1 Tubulin-specific chaperone C [Acanthoscelides obtectus]